MKGRARVLGLVAAGPLVLNPAGARASDDFEDAVRAACAEGAALSDAHLIDLAHATYRSIEATAPRRRCDREHTVEDLLHRLRATQRERARQIELARLYRLTATQTTGHTAKRWRERAYDKYLAGLRMDPTGDGARAGLRLLLVRHRSDAEGEHCARARELLDVRLLWEARLEVARGLASGSESRCRRVRGALVAARTLAYRARPPWAGGRALR